MGAEVALTGWLSPLGGERKRVGVARQRALPPRTDRKVKVGRRRFASMTIACRVLGCSTTKLYSMADRGEAVLG